MYGCITESVLHLHMSSVATSYLVAILCVVQSLCCVSFLALYDHTSSLGCQRCKLGSGLMTEGMQ